MYSLQTYVFAAFLTTTAIALQPVTVEMEPINANGSTEVTLYKAARQLRVEQNLILKREAGLFSSEVFQVQQRLVPFNQA